MIQTFLLVKLGEEGDDEDRKPVCTYFGKRFGK